MHMPMMSSWGGSAQGRCPARSMWAGGAPEQRDMMWSMTHGPILIMWGFMLFMLGMMMGKKKALMMCGMSGRMHGMGMGMGMSGMGMGMGMGHKCPAPWMHHGGMMGMKCPAPWKHQGGEGGAGPEDMYDEPSRPE